MAKDLVGHEVANGDVASFIRTHGAPVHTKNAVEGKTILYYDHELSSDAEPVAPGGLVVQSLHGGNARATSAVRGASRIVQTPSRLAHEDAHSRIRAIEEEHQDEREDDEPPTPETITHVPGDEDESEDTSTETDEEE